MQFERKSFNNSGFNTPAGIVGIYNACRKLYGNQSNPLQVTAVKKYWKGGPDPLDYISMYANAGDATLNVPPHWHYVSYGLSDLHGDGRVHQFAGSEGVSGFGFELTFRVKRERDDTAPPTWPAALLQALARYVFQSENLLCVGDHIPWHTSLDGSETRIQHMLLAEDAQLQPIQTAFGSVSFRQIIGVCSEELKAAQEWNGSGILQLLRSLPAAGGPWLITDMRRGQTIFELNPQFQEQVDDGILQDGSNLSGVTSQCIWQHLSDEFNQLSIKSELEDKKIREQQPVTVSKTSIEIGTCPELTNIHYFNNVHLKFSYDAGSLLLLALKGRLKHGRHFTFKSIYNDSAITLVPATVIGAFVTEEQPFGAQGPWLQVYISDRLLDEMIDDLSISEPALNSHGQKQEYSWRNGHLKVTITDDELVTV